MKIDDYILRGFSGYSGISGYSGAAPTIVAGTSPSSISGLIKGDGTYIQSATPNTDYLSVQPPLQMQWTGGFYPAGVASTGVVTPKYGQFDLFPLFPPGATSGTTQTFTGLGVGYFTYNDSTSPVSSMQVTSLTLPNVNFIQGNFTLSCPLLTKLNLPQLTLMAASTVNWTLGAMVELDMPNVVAWVGNLSTTTPFAFGAILQIFNFNSLQYVTNAYGPNLTHTTTSGYNCPNLKYVGGTFSPGITGDTDNYPNLQYVGGSFTPSLHAGTTNPDYSSLYFISSMSTLMLPAGLTTLNFPALQYTTAGNMTIMSVAAFTTLSMPNIVSMYGGVILSTTMSGIANVTIGTSGITNKIGTPLTLAGAALTQASVTNTLCTLASLTGSNGTTKWSGTCSISGGTSWSPTGDSTCSGYLYTIRTTNGGTVYTN